MKYLINILNKKSITPDRHGSLRFLVTLFLMSSSFFLLPSSLSHAQIADVETNPNEEGFRLTVCDGPTLKGDLLTNANKELQAKYKRNYVPCDFNGVMKQVQHLINIAIILGVLAAIVGFSYAGYLYITGVPGKIEEARKIFPKILGGFIIMLSAWFIVFQILSWLTGDNSGFSKLLGS